MVINILPIPLMYRISSDVNLKIMGLEIKLARDIKERAIQPARNYAFLSQRTISEMARCGDAGKLAKSGVARRKNIPGRSLGSRVESMKLLIFYKSEGKWEGGLRAAREMRWYRRVNKKRRRGRRQRLLVNKQALYTRQRILDRWKICARMSTVAARMWSLHSEGVAFFVITSAWKFGSRDWRVTVGRLTLWASQ